MNFDSIDAMQAFWEKNIRPRSSTRSGKPFELAMIIQTATGWGHHENPRYSEGPILAADCMV